MLKNADCTVYEDKTFAKHIFEGVYWKDTRGKTLTTKGVQVSDSVLVFLYDNSYTPKAGDIIIKGKLYDEYDGSDQAAQSKSMKALREAHPDFAVVKAVDDCMYGGLAHIEITAR